MGHHYVGEMVGNVGNLGEALGNSAQTGALLG